MHSIPHIWTFQLLSTGPVKDAAEVALNSNMSNLIDLNFELHMHLFPKLDLAHAKFDV